MSPRRSLALLAVACAALLSAVPAAPAEAARRRTGRATCMDRGRTLVETPEVRIFERGQGADVEAARFWACRSPRRPARYLFDDFPVGVVDGAPRVAVAGRYVVFSDGWCRPAQDAHNSDPDTCVARMNVYDARRNRLRVLERPRVSGYAPLIDAFAGTAEGWAAWVEIDRTESRRQAVWAVAPGREPVQVAATESGDVATTRTAVAVNGDRLFWTLGGETGTRVLR